MLLHCGIQLNIKQNPPHRDLFHFAAFSENTQSYLLDILLKHRFMYFKWTQETPHKKSIFTIVSKFKDTYSSWQEYL